MRPREFTVRVPKTAELVAHQLRRQIVLGELRSGDALPPEATLMIEFAVSRPTLREAFRVLESEGMISVQRGSRGGARVRAPSGDFVARYVGIVLEHRGATLADLSTARAILEVACVETIAGRDNHDDVARLLESVALAEDLRDPIAQLEAQHHFHELLVTLAGNHTIELLHGALQQVMDRAGLLRAVTGMPGADTGREVGARAHRRLVELLEQRDIEAVGALWVRHIEQTSHYLEDADGGPTPLHLLS